MCYTLWMDSSSQTNSCFRKKGSHGQHERARFNLFIITVWCTHRNSAIIWNWIRRTWISLVTIKTGERYNLEQNKNLLIVIRFEDLKILPKQSFPPEISILEQLHMIQRSMLCLRSSEQNMSPSASRIHEGRRIDRPSLWEPLHD